MTELWIEMKKQLIAGNWKMNGSIAANDALVRALVAGMKDAACTVAVCVPAPYLAQVQMLRHGSAEQPGDNAGNDPDHQRQRLLDEATLDTDQGRNTDDGDNGPINPGESHVASHKRKRPCILAEITDCP